MSCEPSFPYPSVAIAGQRVPRAKAISKCMAIGVLALDDPEAGAADDLLDATATVAAEVVLTEDDLKPAGLTKLDAHGARALTFTTAGGTPADAPAYVDIVGKDIDGAALSETLALSQIAGEVTSVKCYQDDGLTLTYPAADGTDATVSVGIADKFGLPCKIKSRVSSPAVISEAVDGAPTSPALAFAGQARFVNPIAEEVVSIVANVAMADGAQVIAGQPDYPRKLRVDITDGDSSVTAGALTIVGVGADGSALSEAVALTGGTAVKVTTSAFATVTSATIAGLVGATGADLVGVGVDSALGLPIPAGAASVAVNKTVVDSADETVAGVDATARTVDPTSAPDAAKDYDFFYSYTLAPSTGAGGTVADVAASLPYGAYAPPTTPDGSTSYLLVFEQDPQP